MVFGGAGRAAWIPLEKAIANIAGEQEVILTGCERFVAVVFTCELVATGEDIVVRAGIEIEKEFRVPAIYEG